jgi:hypothetical protein
VAGETYPRPKHGWTCFHCGETFRTPGEAAAHFGAAPDATPGCLLKVQLGEERGLLAALRKAEAEIKQLRAQNEQQDYEAANYHGMVSELRRYFAGASTAHQAFLHLDGVEGRAMAAEAIVAAAEKLAPDLIAEAKAIVCGSDDGEPRRRLTAGVNCGGEHG